MSLWGCIFHLWCLFQDSHPAFLFPSHKVAFYVVFHSSLTTKKLCSLRQISHNLREGIFLLCKWNSLVGKFFKVLLVLTFSLESLRYQVSLAHTQALFWVSWSLGVCHYPEGLGPVIRSLTTAVVRADPQELLTSVLLEPTKAKKASLRCCWVLNW